ncbi:hypothetical protein [Silvibacterium acidisoli]|uniref:hypothetical protein n=1 Tax=Acidobacteriaceae bacterium ZG23-2 TaxID=2883246 RepID=UPI00406CC5C3
MSTLQLVYDRALLDSSFREQLSSNTERALASLGILPTSDIVDRVKHVLTVVKQMQQDFGQKYFNDPAVS